ncbi:MAG: TolC family protein [Prevotella sp.]|nr:TolC family protein [Prevotella sp.]MCM1074988.1 TolC family protein [Ruminococcus sp.]
MKRKFIISTFLGFATLFAAKTSAGSLFPFLMNEILGNNSSLHSAAMTAESSKLDNLSGLTLANPEVGVSYMFGSPSDVPNKTNVEVTQGFDFATLSGARRRAARAENQIIDADYMAKRSKLALQVENALIEYVYQYQLVEELTKYARQRADILEIARQSLDAGVITYHIYNENVLSNLTAESDLAQARLALSAAEAKLRILNNGSLPSNLPTAWPASLLPVSFYEWLSAAAPVAPELLSAQANINKTKEEVNLRKKEGLPEFSVGYVNELVKNDNYHGAKVGFSLPLWGNSGRVKAAKAQAAAAQLSLDAASEQFVLTKQSEYDNAKLLLDVADKYDKAYADAISNREKYLDLGYEKGTLSALDYYTAKAALYEYALRSLDARKAFHLARAALYAPTL